MELRPYQQEAVNAVYAFLRTKDTNPCVVAPTASGKSLMMAQIVTDAVTRWSGRVLLLAHVKELLEQNAAKIRALCPGLTVGVYSAGLGSRDTTNQVIVAGIQSVYNKAEELGKFDLILVDECHLIPGSGEGMYRTFLKEARKINPIVRLIGFTATPYRLSGGLICKPENLLNEVCYDIKIPDLIAEGYVSKIISKEGEAEADLEHLHMRNGEFVAEEVAEAMNSGDLVQKACAEIAAKTKDRHHVLIFGSSVAHCEKIAEYIKRFTGYDCPIVTGETPAATRAMLLSRFKGELEADLFGTKLEKPLKYLANVNVLTTGFDAPCTDCVVLLRPTASTALYVQMVGRGFRLSPGKANCLVLDYGGNVLRHGPVNDIVVTDNGVSTSIRKPKICPKCREHIPAKQLICNACGYEFPPPAPRGDPKTSAHSSKLDIVGSRPPRPEYRDVTYDVREVTYAVHHCKNPESPPCLRITFLVDQEPYTIKVWKHPQSPTVWGRQKFANWWKAMCVSNAVPNVPRTAQEAVNAIEIGAQLRTPKRITMRYTDGKDFPELHGFELADETPPEDTFEDPMAYDEEDLPF